jgi:ketosteroid isomerase-like protein
MALEELMKTVLEAWGRADRGPLVRILHDDIVWHSASAVPNGAFNFGGVHIGRANVILLLSKLSTTYFFQSYAAKEIIVHGDIAWGLFDVTANYVPPGTQDLPIRGGARKPLHLETAVRWRMHEGKLIEHHTFFDTALLLAQQKE